MSIAVTTSVRYTHQSRERIEAWQYVGQPFAAWPDWVRSHFMDKAELAKGARRNNWALRDDEGYFWRWLRNDLFVQRYEATKP